MGEKSHYNYRVEPQDVDFTLRATIPSLGSAILNTAGIDAHGKGFGVDALNRFLAQKTQKDKKTPGQTRKTRQNRFQGVA